jgi:hypothetical protein
LFSPASLHIAAVPVLIRRRENIKNDVKNIISLDNNVTILRRNCNNNKEEPKEHPHDDIYTNSRTNRIDFRTVFPNNIIPLFFSKPNSKLSIFESFGYSHFFARSIP